MKIRKFLTDPLLYLFLIIFAGLILRLYKLDSPIADWHSWRQADTAAVTRNFIKEGFNPFFPKGDDMSSVSETGMSNLSHFRFVEFPIYNIATYPLYLIFGIADKYSRLVSILFSLGSVIMIYFITKEYKDSLTALIAAAVLAFLPYNVFYSRTTLPEPTFIFFALGMLYFVDRWIYTQKRYLLIVGFLFAAITFLIKPWGIFFALPLVYSVLKKEGLKIYSIKDGILIVKYKYIFFALFSLLPFLFWRVWINQFPEGIPASAWLYNSDGIRLRPIFFWWLFSERIGREILAVPGVILMVIGLILKPSPKDNSKVGNSSYFFHFWLLSIFAYFVIFATGNIRHDYYQVLFVPVASVFVAVGVAALLKGVQNFIPRFWTIILAFVLFPLMFYFGWKAVIGLYQINNYPIVEAGRMADKILPKDARVIAPYGGDSAFLYQINRAGWPVLPLPVSEMIGKYGATAFVSTAKDADTKYIMQHYVVLEDTPNYVIVDLTRLNSQIK